MRELLVKMVVDFWALTEQIRESDFDKKQKLREPDFYFVLGFRNFVVNPNDYGFSFEADNPYSIYKLDIAQQVSEAVNKQDKEEFGEGVVRIAEVRILENK